MVDVVTSWERRLDESPRAFAAFQVYRDLPPSARSLRRVEDLLEKSHQHIADWSRKYGWVDRVDAREREIDRVLQERSKNERIEFADRQALLGAFMQALGLAKLRTYVDRYDADGRSVTLRDGEHYIDELSISEATRLIQVGARLEEKVRGLPSEPLPIDPISVGDPAPEAWAERAPLTAEAAEEIEALLERMRERLQVGGPATTASTVSDRNLHET